MQRLAKKIEEIGNRITKDYAFYQRFDDIVCDPQRGIVPRGLLLEERDFHSRGSVMVGLNPGQAGEEERAFVKSGPITYERLSEYGREKIQNKWHYHRRLRTFADELGLHGPILWTELVKCQSKINGKLNISTIRADVNKYLFRELEVVPKDWPIIGVGRKSFEVLAYRFPDRLIIGIPHPTGSYGQFHKLLRNNGIDPFAKRYLMRILKKNSPEPEAIYYDCSGGTCRFV